MLEGKVLNRFTKDLSKIQSFIGEIENKYNMELNRY